MAESQTHEYKSSWRDEYLKWICGFANAEGGVLEIGRDDKGVLVGLTNSAKLLEDIPNKVRDVLGIIVDVNLHHEDDKDYLCIVVEAYPSPISYRGQYHYRSGSTKQELRGAALEQFLLKKRGRTWDAVPMPELKADDIDPAALKRFRDLAAESGRMDTAALEGSDTLLLDRLGLREGDYFKRAAALLFAHEPERFAIGASVKIGYFRSGAEISYHDVISGDLLGVMQDTLDALHLKYLKAAITYKDILRIETYPVPRAALREALLNALVHRDYADSAPIQIRVYDDRLTIWNPATLPDGWTQDKLLGEHSSRPYNPSIASAIFRSGEIETWGRGIERIFDACQAANTPAPKIAYEQGELQVNFAYSAQYLRDLVGESTTQETTQEILAILEKEPKANRKRIAEVLGGITEDGVKYQLANMKNNGQIQRIGSTKGGSWKVLTANFRKDSQSSLKERGEVSPFGKDTGKTTQETTQEILTILGREPTASRKHLAEILGNISEDGVKYQLSKMKKEGKIRRVGSTKNGHWEVIQ